MSIASDVFPDIPAKKENSGQLAFRLSPERIQSLKAAGVSTERSIGFAKADWRKAIDATTVSPLLKSSEAVRDFQMIFQACAWSCYAHLAFGNALQVANVLKIPKDQILALLSQAEANGYGISNLKGDLRLVQPDLLIASPSNVSTDAWKKQKLTSRLNESHRLSETCLRRAWASVFQSLTGITSDDITTEEQRRLDSMTRSAIDAQKACAMSTPPVAVRFKNME